MNCLVLLQLKSFLLNLLSGIVASSENYYCLYRLNKYLLVIIDHLKNRVDVSFLSVLFSSVQLLCAVK